MTELHFWAAKKLSPIDKISVFSISTNPYYIETPLLMEPHKKWSFPLKVLSINLLKEILRNFLKENFIFMECDSLGLTRYNAKLRNLPNYYLPN